VTSTEDEKEGHLLDERKKARRCGCERLLGGKRRGKKKKGSPCEQRSGGEGRLPAGGMSKRRSGLSCSGSGKEIKFKKKMDPGKRIEEKNPKKGNRINQGGG